MDHSKEELNRYENGAAGFLETILSEYVGIERIKGEGSDETRFTSNPYHMSKNEFKKKTIRGKLTYRHTSKVWLRNPKVLMKYYCLARQKPKSNSKT